MDYINSTNVGNVDHQELLQFVLESLEKFRQQYNNLIVDDPIMESFSNINQLPDFLTKIITYVSSIQKENDKIINEYDALKKHAIRKLQRVRNI